MVIICNPTYVNQTIAIGKPEEANESIILRSLESIEIKEDGTYTLYDPNGQVINP